MTGMFNKVLNFVGLGEDDYGDEDYLEDRVAPQPRRRRDDDYADEPVRAGRTERSTLAPIRPISGRSGDVPPARLQPVQPVGVRPLPQEPSPPHIVLLTVYREVKEIADTLNQGRPVILNLTEADSSLRRRALDFASGVTYTLGAKIDPVAEKVFLITPMSGRTDDSPRAAR